MKRLLLISILLVDLTKARLRAEAVSYQRQIAPILANRCSTCHGAPSEISHTPAPGGLDTTTYRNLSRGSKSGPVLLLGSPSLSPLLRSPSATEQAICSQFRSQQKKYRVFSAYPPEARPTPKELAACKSAEHPNLNPSELKVVSDWIAEGAKFDGEPPPRNCILFANVDTTKTNHILRVHYRTTDIGVVTLSGFVPSGGKKLFTLSEYTNWQGFPKAGAHNSFFLFEAPARLDVEVCFPFMSRPFGALVSLSDEVESTSTHMAAVDPPEVESSDMQAMTLTLWQADGGTADISLVRIGSNATATNRRTIVLAPGLNRIRLLDTANLLAAGDYVAYVRVQAHQRSAAELAFLVRVDPN